MTFQNLEFHDKGTLLARVLSGSFPEGTHFHTQDEQFIQVATMRWDEDHHMKAHKHNTYKREFFRTNEVMVVRQGRVKATLYNDDGEIVEYILLSAGDIIIFHAGGHAFDTIDPDTEIVEIKNGPFTDVATDKTFLE